MNNNFRASVLSPLINKEFGFENTDGSVTFVGKLTDVEDSPLNGDQWEAFSATFSVDGEQGITLTEQQYTIKHDDIGEVTLFGSPNSATELEFCCSFEIKS